MGFEMQAFSVDLEDWYQGIELPFDSWDKQTKRLQYGLDLLLELLDIYTTKATFFALGWIGEQYPELIKQLTNAGHELGSHGYSHEKVYDLSRIGFREDIRKAKMILEDISGTEVIAFRAPFFSITKESLWALDIVKEEGHNIDCSISPLKTWRYGISNSPDEIYTFKENGLIEFPVSTVKFFNRHFGLGGAYFRLFPFALTRIGFNRRQKHDKATMFYVHPWEYDLDQPVVEMEWKAKITHYSRLNRTLPFTKQLLAQYRFDTVSNVVSSQLTQGNINEYSIDILKD